MPALQVGLPEELPAELAAGLAAIRTELEVPEEFPPDVVAAAERAAAAPRLPEVDRTDLEFITIDPAGSRDLDQAVHITRDGSGFVISYAIADVAAFVTPGDPVDLEAHRRGMTLYAPNCRAPLHPPALSEGAASLLPDQVRPALLWTIRVDARGKMTGAEVDRALVCSRDQLSYVEAQAEIDRGSPRETLELLSLVGRWRERREVERGGVSLQTPEQEVVADDSAWRLVFRAPLPVEGWNAQISLLTGMAAAHLMLYGQTGVLRTMPPAESGALRRLRQTARALGIRWPAELDYPDFVRSLDPEQPREAAMLNACTTLFRGAGYKAFSGGLPEEAEHAALAIDYAHVTAPLRRLVDRYAGEICVALCADRPVPDWVRQRLDGLPDEMAAAERRAKRYERAVIDLVEVFLLKDRVGEVFPGTVVDVDRDRDRGTVVIPEPAVSAKVKGSHLPLGEQVQVRLTSADLSKGVVAFELA
ncbi:MAG TPA: RNB domain-containing ribonuclease [Propionibacteriaceae bacterium]|nr:RNB domain-containing ribonuclease [Propionibacteriaceae bacterium]